jgi:hypothetical protein
MMGLELEQASWDVECAASDNFEVWGKVGSCCGLLGFGGGRELIDARFRVVLIPVIRFKGRMYTRSFPITRHEFVICKTSSVVIFNSKVGRRACLEAGKWIP